MNRIFGLAVVSVVALLTLLLFTLPVPSNAVALIDAGLIIENAYVTDETGARTTESIVMEGGHIVQISETPPVSATATRIDGTGLTAIPGLIDSHTHSYGSALTDALRWGVTANVDMFSAPTVLGTSRAQREDVNQVSQADLYSAGMLATAEGGHGTQFGLPVETLATPDDATAFVLARKKEGSDFIKLVYMPNQSRVPSLDRATARAVIDAAHTEGLLAVAHISIQQAAQHMIEDGIDGLVHVFADEAVSDELVQLAQRNNVFVVPTLAIIASVAGIDDPVAEHDEVKKWLSPMQAQTLGARFPSGIPGFDFETALGNVRALHEGGVMILAGSDAPNPGTAHGYSLHRELELLASAGLSPTEALLAATRYPAQAFGLKQRGELSVGQRADVLLVRGNPYQNVSAARQIKHVIKNGHEISRRERPKSSNPPIETGQLSAFEQDLKGPGSLQWSATSDSIMGGNSTATIERVKRDGENYALAVKAEVQPGFAYPWAGVGLGAGPSASPVDLTAFAVIRFEIRGTPGRYRLMMFSGRGAGAPPTLEFDVTKTWQTVTLPLERFAGFDAKAFSMLSIVGDTRPRVVEFEIDEVRFDP
ncbi:MAG: CIA30 family protein [Pseudomonadota bacterium]